MSTVLEQNLSIIHQKMEQAAKKRGQSLSDIHLIAVTKTIDVNRIEELKNNGILFVGENKVQELTEKYDILGRTFQWHMIGHLQKNKVKYLIDKVDLIHSVDSFPLALEIEKQAKRIERDMDVLIQVNVSREDTKHGIDEEHLLDLIKNISELEKVHVKGLMTIAPNRKNPEENREFFRKLRQISLDIGEKKLNNISMDFLSMGMSNDFEVAIEEGANMIRIGTLLFGDRKHQ
jgi:PLP dependent protein